MLAEQARRYIPEHLVTGAMGKMRETARLLTAPRWEEVYADLDAADLPRPARERLLSIINRTRTLAAMEASLAALAGMNDAWEEAQRYPPRVLRRVEYAPHRPPRRRKPRGGAYSCERGAPPE